jgi:hypothetical protein
LQPFLQVISELSSRDHYFDGFATFRDHPNFSEYFLAISRRLMVQGIIHFVRKKFKGSVRTSGVQGIAKKCKKFKGSVSFWQKFKGSEIFGKKFKGSDQSSRARVL